MYKNCIRAKLSRLLVHGVSIESHTCCGLERDALETVIPGNDTSAELHPQCDQIVFTILWTVNRESVRSCFITNYECQRLSFKLTIHCVMYPYLFFLL